MTFSGNALHPGRRAFASAAFVFAALAMVAVGIPGETRGAESRPLLQAGELVVSERVFLIGLSLRKKDESVEERSRRAREQLLKLRQRLVFAAAGLRRGLDKDPGVTRALEEFRTASLADAYLAEHMRAPSREAATGAVVREGIGERKADLLRRAAKELPAEIDEAVLASVARGEGGDAVVARVGGREIRAGAVRGGMAKIAHPGGRQGTEEGIARLVLDQLLGRVRLGVLADRAGMASRPELQDVLMDRKIRVLADAYVRLVVNPGVNVADQELAAYYGRNKELLRRRGEKEVFAIVVKDRALADAIAARLAAGSDFATEAKAHTEGPGKERGGFVGFLLPEDVQAPLSRVLRTLEPGRTSPVVETPSGYTILRCAQVVDSRVPPLEEVAVALGARLREELESRALDVEAARLEAEIEVRIDETRIQELMKRP